MGVWVGVVRGLDLTSVSAEQTSQAENRGIIHVIVYNSIDSHIVLTCPPSVENRPLQNI